MSSTPNGQASAGVIDPVDTRKGGLPLLMAVLLAAAVAFQLNASMLSPVLTTMAHELGTDEAAVERRVRGRRRGLRLRGDRRGVRRPLLRLRGLTA